MKITRANTEAYAKQQGYELLDIDGVPTGFSWKEPDITIGNKTHKGRVITFKPLGEWEDKDAISYE